MRRAQGTARQPHSNARAMDVRSAVISEEFPIERREAEGDEVGETNTLARKSAQTGQFDITTAITIS